MFRRAEEAELSLGEKKGDGAIALPVYHDMIGQIGLLTSER